MIVITIVLIIIFVFITIKYMENALLDGMWNASANFCEQAGLQSMLLYLQPSFTHVRCGYIIMTTDEGIIINDPVKITIWPSMSFSAYKKHKIDIEWQDSDGYDYFPSNQTMYYYPLLGKMVLMNDDEVTAVLYKNTITSSELVNSVPDDVCYDGCDEI